MSYEKMSVSTVCGNEVRIFDAVQANGKRPLIRVHKFSNHGQAKMYAQDYDDMEKDKWNVRK